MAEHRLRRDPTREEVLTEERVKPKKPRMYRVVLLNDDYTPMEFVVWVLRVVFHKPMDEATRLMLQVHNQGRGVCGVFTYDVARSKATQVQTLARKHEHPLEARLEVVETE
jgi:ATP-dependent Clp protease adaptor protein ClpS